VHRDLKPENICCQHLIDADGTIIRGSVQLIDCGLVKCSSQLRSVRPSHQSVVDSMLSKTISGATRQYAAPERWALLLGVPRFKWPEARHGPLSHGLDHYDTAAPGDTWAAGVTLYELLTGVRPFGVMLGGFELSEVAMDNMLYLDVMNAPPGRAGCTRPGPRASRSCCWACS